LGSTSVEVVKQTTYPQEWTAYNAAQTEEKDRFQVLLRDLCSGIQEPIQTKGRPRVSLADQVFCAAFKVYTGFAARRFASDLREAEERRLINKAPHFNSVLNALENPDLRPILTSMIETSALPLQSVETDFAADSTGFNTCRYEKWVDHKYGGERFKREWVKAHIMCGVKTNIVTAVEIRDKDAADAPLLPALLRTTQSGFAISEVSADKGYLSYDNASVIANAGATPFIAFKNNSGPGDWRKEGRGRTEAWAEMFHYFMYRRNDFLAHYHKRSNVETTFSMMKRKFGDSLRSKTDTAMVNEALCKILCHNLAVLIHEIHELGISPIFTAPNA
jgi:transposase